MLRSVAVIAALAGLSTSRAAAAEPAPEPSGPHPRILIDATLRAAWKQAAGRADSAVARAIARCEDTRRNPGEYQRDSYMGFDWSASLAACLIAYEARGSDDDARSAVGFVRALLDDLQRIGDGQGGERSVRRDTGYAIRSVPPYVALAYDWLHDHPALTPAVQQKIRERMQQWIGWYTKEGYHNRTPGSNYHAGYLISATLAAVAIGGEAGDYGGELWRHVRDVVWGKDMAKVLAPGGLLDGGDFPEGWQYAPLTVAEYALGARIMARHGVPVAHADRWLTALLVRTLHARSGARDAIAAIGDTEFKSASIAIDPLTLMAVLVGPAPEIAQRQARYLLERLGLSAPRYPLYAALAEATAVTAAKPVLDKWPTSYFAPGIQAFYGRTSWGKQGVWLATTCPPALDADHLPPAAGNVLLTRGVDEVLVDPSPYGSLSSLTSNAPTVESAQQLPKYRPSQAPWGEATHFVWAVQTAAGVIATRCDYADQYKFQDRASDIPRALRDLVLIPWTKGADASVVVVDRADTGAADREMHLRFRSPSRFTLDGDVARAKVGGSTFTVRRIAPAGVKPEVRPVTVGDCWDVDRGQCDRARIPVGEYRIVIPGPTMEAIHVLDAAAADDLAVDVVTDGVVHLRRGGRDAYVAVRPVAYTVKPSPGALHVVLADAASTPTVTRAGAGCKIEVARAATGKPAPLVFTVDDKCTASTDTRTGPASPDLAGSAAGTLISVGDLPQQRGRKSGCCDAGAGPGGPGLLALLVGAALGRRRRRATRGE